MTRVRFPDWTVFDLLHFLFSLSSWSQLLITNNTSGSRQLRLVGLLGSLQSRDQFRHMLCIFRQVSKFYFDLICRSSSYSYRYGASPGGPKTRKHNILQVFWCPIKSLQWRHRNKHAQGARPPTPQAACVHQIHATGTGGASGSTTMLMVFGRWLVLFVWFLTRDSSDGHVLPTF